MIFDAHALAATTNQELEEVYSVILPEWKQLFKEQKSLGKKLSVPCFLKVEQAYFEASIRVLFVGQETHGWWDDWEKSEPNSSIGSLLLDELTVPNITDFYSRIRPYLLTHTGPYWDALRFIVRELHLDAVPASYLFSNIFPCDLDKRRAPEDLLRIFQRWTLLSQEVERLRPDWIVFFSGPIYSGNFVGYFGESAPPLSINTPICDYSPQNCSWRGLLTYHPNALRRLELQSVIPEIISRIKG